MNQNLKKSGMSLLNALSNHSELIMQAYFTGAVVEADYSPKVIDNLVDLKVLYRPESEAQLRLRPALRTLLEESLQDENNRQIDANITTNLATLKTQAEHYKEALVHARYAEAESKLADLTENVYTLTDTLTTNVRLLWSRISNEFGYVSSVDAKIRENELAQTQVREILTQLESFRFDELSQAAGAHRELRHMLVVTLQSSFATCTQELSLVQAKLIQLLGQFREFRGRTRLLKGFLLHMEQKPDFAPHNYAALMQVPNLFNRAQRIIQPAAVDVNNVEQESELFDIVRSIRTIDRMAYRGDSQVAAKPIEVQEQESVTLDEDALKLAVEDYYCEVIDSGEHLHALDYMQQRKLSYDPEVWLYQVIGGYEGLPDEEKEYFELEVKGVPHPDFSGNFIIQDVAIGLR